MDHHHQAEDDLQLHLQKPPPPYEEVERETSTSSSVSLPTSSSGIQTKCDSKSANISTSASKFNSQPHSLSIENPMAEVFANPEFDHVELKIQGHINPTSSVPSSSSDSNSTHSGSGSRKMSIASSLSSMANMAKEKSRQVFVQWKDWHRPEVIVIRMALLLLALMVIVHMARIVLNAPSLDNNNHNRPTSAASKQLQHSARTGKAMSTLLSTDIDKSLSMNDPFGSPAEIKITHTKIEQPDLDVLGGDDLDQQEHHDLQTSASNNYHPSLENEPSLMEQDLDHHDSEPSSTTITFQSSSTSIKSSTTISTTSTTTTTTTTTAAPSPSTIRTRLSSTILIPSSTTTTTMVPVKISSSKNIDQSKTYNISIIIHSANVPDMDSGYLLGRASDTYCNVFIDDVLVGKTPIIDNSNNPSWHYLLPRQFTVKKDTWIRIELMDSDHVRNDHIGGILLNFGDLIKNGSLNKPINMFHGRGYIWVTISAQNF